MKRWLIILLIFFLTGFISATNYYVGYALTSDCLGDYSILNRACTGSEGYAYNNLYYVNQIVSAGDTVYLRSGTNDYKVYNITVRSGFGEGIQPFASGTDYD